MRIRLNNVVLLLAAFALGVPTWAAKMDVAHIDLDHQVTVAGTMLPAGSYDFHAEPGQPQVEILRSDNHKMVATVQGKWISLKSKAPYTQVLTDQNQVQEVEFAGKNQAIQFSGS